MSNGKSRNKKPLTEEQEHIRVARALDKTDILWCHYPAGGLRGSAASGRLKRMGLKRGVPDIFIFDPPPSDLSCGGMAVELKRLDQRSARVSDEQTAWMSALEARGWLVAVCYGHKEAINTIRNAGYDIKEEK